LRGAACAREFNRTGRDPEAGCGARKLFIGAERGKVMGEASRKARIFLALIVSGALLIVAVFVLAVHFALTYQRPSFGGDLSSSIGGFVSEALYLLGKAVFLSLGILAAAQLLRYGVELARGGRE